MSCVVYSNSHNSACNSNSITASARPKSRQDWLRMIRKNSEWTSRNLILRSVVVLQSSLHKHIGSVRPSAAQDPEDHDLWASIAEFQTESRYWIRLAFVDSGSFGFVLQGWAIASVCTASPAERASSSSMLRQSGPKLALSSMRSSHSLSGKWVWSHRVPKILVELSLYRPTTSLGFANRSIIVLPLDPLGLSTLNWNVPVDTEIDIDATGSSRCLGSQPLFLSVDCEWLTGTLKSTFKSTFIVTLPIVQPEQLGDQQRLEKTGI